MAPSTSAATDVGEVMTHGVINAPPQASLHELAAQMTSNRVHCVVVEGLARVHGGQEQLVWGIVSDLDLIKAVVDGRKAVSAGEIAATEIVTAEASESIEQAARLMAEHECAHLIVVSGDDGRPIGVVSSLDVAAAIARSDELES